MPAADFATSVAVDTAMPICACRNAGASFIPAHPDGEAIGLQGFDDAELILRQHTGNATRFIRHPCCKCR
jgi:hypothetical protein